MYIVDLVVVVWILFKDLGVYLDSKLYFYQ